MYFGCGGGTSCKTEVNETVDTTAPAEATLLAANAGDSQAILSWTNPTDEDFYGVEVSATPATTGTLANPVILTGTTSSLTVTGLANATEYTFTVKTIDKSLNTSTGTAVTATPADSSDKTAPAAITNLSATNKDASVLLTWTDNSTDSDIYGYEVSWNKDTAINRSATSTAVASGTMIVAQGNGGCYVSNLTNGTEYTFTVKAVDTSGNKSTGVSATITPEPLNSITITLTESVTDVTKDDVKVTVSATSKNNAMTKVSYSTGIVTEASTVLSSGIELVVDQTTGLYSFTVSANGSYTVAATLQTQRALQLQT